MNKGRKILFVVSFLVVDLCLLVGIFLIRDFTFKNILMKEVTSLVNLDLKTDRFNTEVKSSGEYAVVEKSIKEYFDNYAVHTQLVFDIKNDEYLKNMLTVSNYKNDGPMFYNSFLYLNSIKTDFNNKVDLLLDVDSEKILNDVVSDKSEKIYDNLLLNDVLLKKLNENKTLLESEKEVMNKYFDSIYNILILLRDNVNSYNIVKDKIIFNDVIIEQEYLNLLKQAKRIYE